MSSEIEFVRRHVSDKDRKRTVVDNGKNELLNFQVGEGSVILARRGGRMRFSFNCQKVNGYKCLYDTSTGKPLEVQKLLGNDFVNWPLESIRQDPDAIETVLQFIFKPVRGDDKDRLKITFTSR